MGAHQQLCRVRSYTGSEQSSESLQFVLSKVHCTRDSLIIIRMNDLGMELFYCGQTCGLRVPFTTILCLWGNSPSHLLKSSASALLPYRVKSPACIKTSPFGISQSLCRPCVSEIHTTRIPRDFFLILLPLFAPAFLSSLPVTIFKSFCHICSTMTAMTYDVSS